MQCGGHSWCLEYSVHIQSSSYGFVHGYESESDVLLRRSPMLRSGSPTRSWQRNSETRLISSENKLRSNASRGCRQGQRRIPTAGPTYLHPILTSHLLGAFLLRYQAPTPTIVVLAHLVQVLQRTIHPIPRPEASDFSIPRRMPGTKSRALPHTTLPRARQLGATCAIRYISTYQIDNGQRIHSKYAQPRDCCFLY